MIVETRGRNSTSWISIPNAKKLIPQILVDAEKWLKENPQETYYKIGERFRVRMTK